ncbi:hypothetical protein BDZ45DRAFT_743595 [Acephala macrosclerotiorum]|nr:hypothetical protein BDZ45DRAFT_743595 [Acephala macrosclerotiorum]
MTKTTCGGGETTSRTTGSHSLTGATNSSQNSTQNSLGRRRREAEDDEDQNNGNEKSPKRPRTYLSPPQNQDDNTKFACPYRKRDPRKYCLQNWRPCALTPLETVARVKGHLYRHHRIFPCQRCKELFKDQDAVNLHLKEPKGCELRDVEHADGKDIYKLLFPNEMIPNPYFEAVQEDLVLSPDSRELADYEEYCRRELPRDFRAALEEIVHNESQPIEESIVNQLMNGRLVNIIRDCQDRVFSRYRSSAGTAAGTPSRNPTTLHSPVMASQEARPGISMTTSTTPELSLGRIAPPFFQPLSPQTHLRSRLEVSDLQNNVSKAPEGRDPSDSGYSSNGSGLHSSLSSSFQHSTDSASTSQSQSYAAFEEVLDHTQIALGIGQSLFQYGTDNSSPNSRDIAINAFDSSWLNYDPELAEGNDWNVYMGI